MKKIDALAVMGLLTMSPLAIAQDVFTGTWRQDFVELFNGIYDCRSCTPPFKIKADGSAQSITGNPYYDTLSIATVDDRTVTRTAKQAGKTVFESKIVVSTDGKTKTEVQTLYFMAPRPIEMTSHSSLLSGGRQGSHLTSGTWRMTDSDVSNHAEDTIFKISGEKLDMSDRIGRSFSAKLDGTEAPYNGSNDFNSVSLKQVDNHTIEESDKKDGKVVKISLWSVDAAGKTMHVRFDDT